MSSAVYRTGAIAALLAVGYVLLKHLVVARFVGPARQPVAITPAQVGLPCQEINLNTADGLTLEAWWASTDDSSQTAILVHGWGGDKSESHVVETARIYHEADFNVLLVNLRCHGNSGGRRITGGYQELYDVRATFSWLKDQGFKPQDMVLHGWSMGAATVIRAAPEENVRAVVEEAGYADLTSVFGERLAGAIGLPSFPDLLIVLASKALLDMDPRTVCPEEEAHRLWERGIPLLVIHSRADEVVPFEHARRFVRAHPEAILWELEGYPHVGAYAHPEYRRKLLDFLRKASG